MADEEQDRDDRRRLRRASKASTQKQNQTRLAAERQLAASGETSAAATLARQRVEARKTEEMLQSDRRVTTDGVRGGSGKGKGKRGRDDGEEGLGEDADARSYAKSAAFFSNLQVGLTD